MMSLKYPQITNWGMSVKSVIYERPVINTEASGHSYKELTNRDIVGNHCSRRPLFYKLVREDRVNSGFLGHSVTVC